MKEYFKNAKPWCKNFRAAVTQAIDESRRDLDPVATQEIVGFSSGTAAIHILAPPTVLSSAVSHLKKMSPPSASVSLPKKYFQNICCGIF